MSTDERTDPPHDGDEATTLLGFLDYHRATLRLKTTGLDARQLAVAHPPSTMTLGGMLKHLALVETSWLSEDFLDEPMLAPFDTVDWSADWDWDWHSASDDTPEELRRLFDTSVAASDVIIADALAHGGLGRQSVRAGERSGETFSLRWILVHLVEEYARHNGHADLIRESIDGAVGE